MFSRSDFERLKCFKAILISHGKTLSEKQTRNSKGYYRSWNEKEIKKEQKSSISIALVKRFFFVFQSFVCLHVCLFIRLDEKKSCRVSGEEKWFRKNLMGGKWIHSVENWTLHRVENWSVMIGNLMMLRGRTAKYWFKVSIFSVSLWYLIDKSRLSSLQICFCS